MRPAVELLEDRCLPATFVVNTLADTVNADPSITSLRDAVTAANNQAGDDTITFAAGLTGTIQLTGALPDLTDNVAIQGPGAGVLEVRRNTGGDYRIFFISPATTDTISGLTLSNGNVPGGIGGGIYNRGTLTLINCTLAGNTAAGGGGIINFGTLALTNTTLSTNTANDPNGPGGGGIGNDGTLTLTNSTLSGNTTANAGGGINNALGTLTLINSTLSGNTALQGGGIENDNGTLALTNCTLSGNTGTQDGGGIYNNGTLALTNCTVAANLADAGNKGVGTGGGIFIISGATTLRNTIVAGNFRGISTTRDDVRGAVSALSSFNLIGDGTGLTGISNNDPNGNQVGSALAPIDPRLGPLQNNGGPTQTHALLSNSPAINRGLDPAAPPADQRGVGRSGAADIGAFEYVPPLPPPPPPPVFAAHVLRRKALFLVRIVDATTGAMRLQLRFPFRVQVLRQDVNGDGVLDIVVLFRQGRRLRRLAFSGRDLSPLAA